jgi:hypothetical protein
MEYEEFVNEYQMVELWEAANGFMMKTARDKWVDAEY